MNKPVTVLYNDVMMQYGPEMVAIHDRVFWEDRNERFSTLSDISSNVCFFFFFP